MIRMKTSAREDVLEALCILSRRTSSPVFLADLSESLSLDPSVTRERLVSMEQQGDLRVHPDERIELTEQGFCIGKRVMRKHKVLECFLSEILGMEPGAASDEACILEHGISDEAVDRLDRYISRPGARGRRMRRMGMYLKSLTEFPEGSDLHVLSIKCPGGCQRLSDMGIFPGERVTLIHTLKNGAVVVRVKGCDIALSPEIASCIYVERPE